MLVRSQGIHLPNKKSNKLHVDFRRKPAVDLALLAALTSLQGCSSFGAYLGNNGDVANACVDQDLSNGDSCAPVWVPSKPDNESPPETREE